MAHGPQTCPIAIIGANGAVGREMTTLLLEAGFSAEDLRLFGSSRSAGLSRPIGGQQCRIEELTPSCFDGIRMALFAAGADVAQEWAPKAVAAGATVIDNSSAFRGDPSVPLIVPEINGTSLQAFKRPGIVANPNCSTIIALMAVAPIHQHAHIQRMNIATYQSVSGAGAAGIAELEQQTADYVAKKPLTNETFPTQALFNVFCHESPIGPDGFNEEERKIRNESRRILSAPDLAISATCVRVGVPRAHAMAIELDLEQPLSADEARELLECAPGITVIDDVAQQRFPEPLHAAGQNTVLVGRLRNAPDCDSGQRLLLFACGDQLRKGAALNAIQILNLISGLE